ncbi:MAG: tetratricopeptide repeat protein [Catenulispora sp.]|nr:tetratricopeptide repeat protein [Catenulispora sp.]
MRIEIWADIANPWTHVAAERLRAALGTDGETQRGEGTPDTRYPGSDTSAPTDVVWRPLLADAADPDAPRDALRLLALAEERGGAALQNRVAEELLASHDLRDRAELAAVAERAGFAEGGALLRDSEAGAKELRELLLIGKARRIGVSPTLAVGDQHLEFALSPATVADFLASCAVVKPLPEEVRRLRWAESLVGLNDPLGALVLLEPLLAEHGDDPNIRRVAASAYFASAQLGRAEAVLEAMLAAHPDDSNARVMLGKTLKRRGRGAEAETHLRMAAAMTPEYA